MNKNVIITL